MFESLRPGVDRAFRAVRSANSNSKFRPANFHQLRAKGSREHAQLIRLSSGESGELATATAIDQALFKIHAHAR